MNPTERNRNRQVKALLKGEFPGVRVRQGSGTACGWCKIYVTIPKAANCFCTSDTRTCQNCNAKGRETVSKIENMIAGVEFYHYYDDMSGRHKEVNIHVNFEEN